jgi:hypothetical protein
MRRNLILTLASFGYMSMMIFTSCTSSTGPSNTVPIDQPMGGGDENVGWEVGKTAPDFTLNTIDHGTISLSQYSGKVVFLFFLGNN